MTRITLKQANEIINAALATAAELRLKPMAVAVLDAGGHTIAAQRQDGTSNGRLQVATAKAAGALFLGVSSRRIGEMAVDRPTFVASIATQSPQGVVPAAGSVIVVDGAGLSIGAVGISGDSSDNDEKGAVAGIRAAGLAVQN